ncbi:MAG TPA: hypothetical protein VN896_14655 [Methylomirabilota bacterium]|nr:hypothetical protein [Methylomirabilota bacterium]
MGSKRAALVALAWLVVAVPATALDLLAPRFTREQMEERRGGARSFRFVYGTRDPAAAAILRARAFTLAVRAFGGDSGQVVADRDVDEKAFAAGPIYLVGSPRENAWTDRIAPALPVRFAPGSFTWQGKVYDRPADAIHLAWANPLAPDRFLLLSAANSPAALANRSNLVLLDEDWRIVRDGQLARSGRFAQDPAHPWAYDPRRDRDREAERERYVSALVVTPCDGVVLRSPSGLPLAADVAHETDALLARMAAAGLAAPAGAAKPSLTLYRSLEEKGAITSSTLAEHVLGGRGALAAHAALPFSRDALDLWSVAGLRLLQCGGDAASRFWRPAATYWAGRFEGERLERALSRLYFAGLLPTAAEAATRAPGGEAATGSPDWRSPLVWTPARALLVRAVWESAPSASRRAALLALVRDDPGGTLDSLCRAAGVTAVNVERRYKALGDSLARANRVPPPAGARAPWRPANGFQRGVDLAHAVGLERGYLSAACARELARIKEAGADWVALTPFAWLADPRQPVLGNSTSAGPDGESDEAICEAAAHARALGLRVWLKPHVWTRGWEGELEFGPSAWRQFLDGYDQLVIHWTLIAAREGLDGIFIGHELASATAADPEHWRSLIGRVRKAYAGNVCYCATWDEAPRVPFWDALDVIAVSFYAPLAEQRTDDPAVLRAGAAKTLGTLRAVARRFGRPVLIAELGYAASVNAAVRPWDDVTRPGGVESEDEDEAQRACFEAAIAAMDPYDWLAGVFFWKWGSAPRAGDDPLDFRGRPAEDEVRGALKGWTGRPVRVPPPNMSSEKGSP